ncbi:MAG: hypothetical protein E6K54_06950 [Gammaproteobacteria bacterium]|nr:MAG: hypothetical protein E6K54_06950 [Gammaproteobacteria bacterium]
MLDEIAENSMEIPPEPQQDPDVFPRAANTGNYARNTNTSLGFFNTASNQAISSVSPSNELTHDRQNLLR